MSATQTTIEIGKSVLWASRTWRVLGYWSHNEVILQDISSDTSVVAPRDEVRDAPTDSALSLVTSKMSVSKEDWDSAVNTYRVIKALYEDPRRSAASVEEVARQLGINRSTAYVWLNWYKENPCAEVFLPQKPGVKRGTRLLPKEVEAVIAEIIDERSLTRNGLKGGKLVKLIQRVCRRLGFKAPSKAAILSRLEPFNSYKGKRARRGGKEAADELAPRPGTHVVPLPLDEVQIDHTLIDIIAVSGDEYRYVVGRPWLTVAMDVCTRLIVGYYLAYEHPNSYSVGLATAHACFEKVPLLHAMGIDEVEWGAHGAMKKILVDNAREHKAESYVRACENRGIEVVYRDMPHYGGHIERLIGTAVRNFHALPGTTRESIEKRGDYDAEAAATMTFEEINRFLVYKFCAYNHTIHSALDQSPWSLWQKLNTVGYPPKYVAPRSIENPHQFLLELMPYETRIVRRDGIHMFGTRYWTPELVSWVHNHEQARILYDPRDISAIYVPVPGAASPLVVPYADLRMPRISLSEWKCRKREARMKGYSATELALSDHYEDRADGVADQSRVEAKKSKKLRKREEATRTTNSTVDAWRKAHGVPSAATCGLDVQNAEEPLYTDVDDIPDAAA